MFCHSNEIKRKLILSILVVFTKISKTFEFYISDKMSTDRCVRHSFLHKYVLDSVRISSVHCCFFITAAIMIFFLFEDFR